jgi:hypothetical protein
MEETFEKETKKSRNKKLFFFGLLFFLCILLFAAIIYKLWKRDTVKPNFNKPQDTVFQNIPKTRAEAIEVLEAKTTPEIRKLLTDKAFSVNTFLDEKNPLLVPPVWTNDEIFQGISLESYLEWINQLSNVNSANCVELVESLSEVSPDSPEYASIKERINISYVNLLKLIDKEYGYVAVNKEEKFEENLFHSIEDIRLLIKVDPKYIYEVKTIRENDKEALEIAKKRLTRAFDLSIQFMVMLLPFDLGYFTEDVLNNHTEFRDYVINNF